MKKIVSGMMLILFLVGSSSLLFDIQPAKANGTIYIRADGSIDPPTPLIMTRDRVTYTFTGNVVNSTIVVERSNITLDGKGHTLQGSGVGYGFDLYDVNGVTIRNTNIEGFEMGVFVYLSSYNIIAGNNITENHADGIGLDICSNNTVAGNNIENNYAGIWLESSSNNTVAGNNVTRNKGYGIVLEHVLGSVPQGSSDRNIVAGNNITGNHYAGILLKGYSNTISGNNITGNYWDGIWLEAISNNNTVAGNNIESNSGRGIELDGSSNNIFHHNNIIDNRVQVYTSNSTNFWNDSYSEGNYWSNYTGIDSNHDGIGDTPHIIDGYNQDNCPLMSPYIPGDYNHDGTVNMTDVDLVRVAWQSRKGDLGYNPHADFNRDRIINIKDATIIGINWLEKWENR